MTADIAPDLGQPALEVEGPDPADLQLWSVTTILGVLEKRGLMWWAAEQTALAAIDEQPSWQGLLAGTSRDAAIDWLRRAHTRRQKDKLTATTLGSIAHSMFESYALTGTRPTKEEVAEAVHAAGGDDIDLVGETNVLGHLLNQFDGWLQRFSPAYQATEVTVYSPTYGYAGQADAFLDIEGTRFIVDYKTSRSAKDSQGKPRVPYPSEVGLQLAAYRNAEFAAVWRPRRFEKWYRRYYLLGQAEQDAAVPVPEVDGGLCIQVTPEACESYPIRCDQEVHRAFLFTLEVFRWVQETSKSAMGQKLEATA